MNFALRQLLLFAMLTCFAAFGSSALAQQTPEPPTAPTQPAVEEPPATVDEQVEAEVEDQVAEKLEQYGIRVDGGDKVIVQVGHDAHLRAGESADAVISIFGSATSEGDVRDAVISIFGDTRVTGPLTGAAIAIFGDTYVNSRVGDTAIALFGNLTLGPDAVIEHEAVTILGSVNSDPAAIVRGGTVTFGQNIGGFEFLRPWFEKCLLYGRPLAIAPGLGWAWALALAFLGLYVLISLLFSRSVERCVETLENQPGQSVIAGVLTVLLTPPLMLLLVVTIIGIAVVPIAGMALLCAALFGKAVILAALGRRITKLTGIAMMNHIVVATIIGGLLVLAIYVVPVLGFIAQNVIGLLGLGVVVYTLLLALRARTGGAAPVLAQPIAVAAAAPAVAAQDAFASASAGPAPTSAPASDTSAPAAPAAPAAETALTTAASAPRAGFWIRMGALSIDVILVGVIVDLFGQPDEAMLLGLAAYGAVMWKFKSTTIGGILCSLKVVRLDGRELSWDTAIVRALGCILSVVAVGLGFFWIAFDKERQAWHDKIAGTVVVRVPGGSLV
jgi:uncharacterized RDD family membrane protein YckC